MCECQCTGQSQAQTLRWADLGVKRGGESGSFTYLLLRSDGVCWRGRVKYHSTTVLWRTNVLSTAFSDIVQRILTETPRHMLEPWVQVLEGVGDRWLAAALAVVLTPRYIHRHQTASLQLQTCRKRRSYELLSGSRQPWLTCGKGVGAEPLPVAPVLPRHLCPLSHPKHWTHTSGRRTARGPWSWGWYRNSHAVGASKERHSRGDAPTNMDGLAVEVRGSNGAFYR